MKPASTGSNTVLRRCVKGGLSRDRYWRDDSLLIGREDMRYRHALPTSTSFSGNGLFGYTFGPLQQKDLESYYIEVEKGHDTFMISNRITRIYYVLSGNGYFTIDSRR